MKIIDGQGKLFGKINIIDFLIILFLVCLIPIFYFGYRIFNTKHKILQPLEFIYTEVNCNLIKLKPEILESIAAGDIERDKQAEKIGEIIWIGDSKPYEYRIDIGAEEIRVIKDTPFRELPAILRLKLEVKEDNLMYYKDKKIGIGLPFYFVTDKYAVVAIPSQIKKEKSVQIKVRFSQLPMELSSIIKKGDIEKDKTDKIIGKIIDIISNTPTQISAIKLDENKIVLIDDSRYHDIIVLLEILCDDKNGALVFKDSIVKVGNTIDFTTDLYTVSGMVIGFSNI